jgi:hypothetical protein
MICKMYPDEANIDGSLVSRSIKNQFPHSADLQITAVPSAGPERRRRLRPRLSGAPLGPNAGSWPTASGTHWAGHWRQFIAKRAQFFAHLGGTRELWVTVAVAAG